jgi:hypothetical protein
MLLGAVLLCSAMWGQAPPWLMASWGPSSSPTSCGEGALVRAWHRVQPGLAAATALGPVLGQSARRWAARSGVFASVRRCIRIRTSHQALLIVCLFGVVLERATISTAVYKPSFYGFVIPALVPAVYCARRWVADHCPHVYSRAGHERRARIRFGFGASPQ